MTSLKAARILVKKKTLPKNEKEMKRLATKVQEGVNISLFARNKNPKKSIQGTGFANRQKALETIQIVERDCRDVIHQKQVILTMFNRAKFHPHRTQGMRDAMGIFAPWMKRHGMKAEL